MKLSPSTLILWVSTPAVGMVIALAIAGLLVTTVQVLLLLFAGILIGVSLNGLTNTLSGAVGQSYGRTFSCLVVLGFLLILGLGWLLGHQMASQIDELTLQLRNAANLAIQKLDAYPTLQSHLADFDVPSLAGRAVGMLPSGLSVILWGITCIAVIGVVGLYTAYEPQLYKEGFSKLIPPARRAQGGKVLHGVGRVLQLWMIGRLLSMTIVGVSTAIFLWLIGVPLAMSLGVLAAVLTFIPNVGPILATIPQLLLALQLGTNILITVLLFNLLMQFVESYLITPLIQQRQVSLPPALTVFAQLLLGVLFGILGIVLAAPITASILYLVQTLYIANYLGDPEPGHLTDRLAAD